MNNTASRLNKAEQKIWDPAFREGKGLGNEVNYYVFDYPPEDELTVRDAVKAWQSRNSKGADGFELAVFDLYEIIISLLEQEGFLEQCFKFEEKHGMERVIKSVGRLLRLNDDAGIIVKHIKENTPEGAVALLTGIGKCFPILRSHKVLNNLHQEMDSSPVVMLYPGKYNGQELILFGEVKDDNSYRAFRLVD
jgi:hypothetical protein